jgi:4-diphosphocytidyl-2-C-methyl-D-erythritol kinase
VTEEAVQVRAPAKVNLWLRVAARDASGKHPLFTLFQAITRFDELRLETGDEDQLEVHGTELPEGGDNLVWRAVTALRELTGRRRPLLQLRLVKRIPVAAGLGGGSADAAAALIGLAALLEEQVDPDDLAELAAGLGADVPFALRGGTALGEGFGDRLTELTNPPGGYALAVVVPPVELATGDVYATWDRLGGPTGRAVAGRGLPPSLREHAPLRNDLEPAARALAPLLDDWRADLEERWDRPVLLTGSGPALFALFGDEAEAEAAVDASPPGARAAFAARPHPRGAERVEPLQ